MMPGKSPSLASISVPTQTPTANYAWFVLGAVTILTVLSYIDRQLLVLLAPQIQGELQISDTKMGLLLGVAFALLYGFAAIPAGMLADSKNRRNIMFGGLVFWSFATIACGLSRNYYELFLARMAVGVGEACLGPAAISLLADYFHPQKRGRALAIFQMGSIVGGGIALVGGGALLSLINDASDVTIFNASFSSWKLIFLAMGAISLAYSPFVLLVREPQRQGAPTGVVAGPATAQISAEGFWRGNLPLVVSAYALFAMCGFVGFATNSWLPSVIVRDYNIPLSEAGLMSGTVLVTAGIGGALSGGWLGDRFILSGAKGGRFDAVLIAWVCLLGAVTLMAFDIGLWVMLVAFAIFAFTNTMIVALAPSVLSDIFPAKLRGIGMAIYFLNLAIFGMACGPVAVAIMNDYAFGGNDLRLAIVLVSAFASIGAIAIGLVPRRIWAVRHQPGQVGA